LVPGGKEQESPWLDGGGLMRMEIDCRDCCDRRDHCNYGASGADLPWMCGCAWREGFGGKVRSSFSSCAEVAFLIRIVAPVLRRLFPDVLKRRGMFAGKCRCDARIPDYCLAGWSLVGCCSI